jgi:hypothetical protein
MSESTYLDKRVRVLAGPCKGNVGTVADVKSTDSKTGNCEQLRVKFSPPIRIESVGNVSAVWRRADEFVVVGR